VRFRIIPADTFIWNYNELIDFLLENQNQSIVIENGTEGCCARSVGLYTILDKFKFADVIIETSNILETHPAYKVKYVLPWKFINISQPVESELHAWNKTALFGTLYGRPLWHRLGIAAHLLTHYSDISKVGFVANPANQDQRELYELTQLWQHSPQSFVNFANTQHLLPLVHQDIDNYAPGSTLTDGFVAQTKKIYPNFLVDIVAETFISGDCFFITEKTIRPMLLKKPFIVMGSKNFLGYLRQLGFKTFYEFWDENYDGYADGNRYNHILKLIDQVATMRPDELEAMYHSMQDVLDHNYNLLISSKFKKTIVPIHD